MLILNMTQTHLDGYKSSCIWTWYSSPTANHSPDHTINSVTLTVLGKFRNRKNLEFNPFAVGFFLYTNCQFTSLQYTH